MPRIEKDPLGEKPVPDEALYGIQTVRAVENFPISGLRPLPAFVDAVIWIKRSAALTHKETGRLEAKLADAIVKAADEVLSGRHRDQFVVDVYQAGAGTSHNMNCNEVLANRANELLGGKRGEYTPVHPNDHVNMAQSTNDVIPTAMRLSVLATLPDVNVMLVVGAAVVVALIGPIVFSPISFTLWQAVDLWMRRPTPAELAGESEATL